MGLYMSGQHYCWGLLHVSTTTGENRDFRIGCLHVYRVGADVDFHRPVMVPYKTAAQKRPILGNFQDRHHTLLYNSVAKHSHFEY